YMLGVGEDRAVILNTSFKPPRIFFSAQEHRLTREVGLLVGVRGGPSTDPGSGRACQTDRRSSAAGSIGPVALPAGPTGSHPSRNATRQVFYDAPNSRSRLAPGDVATRRGSVLAARRGASCENGSSRTSRSGGAGPSSLPDRGEHRQKPPDLVSELRRDP